jgi:two-component system, OmpR family, sensor kinase
MNPTAQNLSVFRYCKWRWLHFRRSWTDTRADRMPSWSRLYLRAYLRLLGLALLVVVIPLLGLSFELTAGVVWHGFAALPGGVVPVLIVVFGAPAVVAYRWMRPVWVDLVMVRERAIDFTGGRFNTSAWNG